MAEVQDDPRSSHALVPEVTIRDEERRILEVRNQFRQYDAAISTIREALERGSFQLRPSLILDLHREGCSGLTHFAGAYRPTSVAIVGSRFQPPEASHVPKLVEDMCDYVNEHWDEATPLHLAAFIMWRLNWIHPFTEGNGSTARILSYVVLSIRYGSLLPGTPTIPEQIVAQRRAYFAALEQADLACEQGQVDISAMEELLGQLLSKQLGDPEEDKRGN